MKKWQLMGMLPLALVVTACGTTADTSATTANSSIEELSGSFGGGNGGNFGSLDKSWDTELSAMLEEAEASFTQDTYTDAKTGLSVPYNVYVPAGYAGDGTAPIMFFIGDA